jgi:peptide/nickel transport system permease protein
MATPQATFDVSELEQLRIPFATRLLQLIRKQPLGAAGAFIVIIMGLAAIFANVVSPYDPELNDLEHMLEGPNAVHWMGSDEFGRDILTRVMYGARTALVIGLTAAFFGATGGLVLGVASAYFGGIFDLITQRLVDVFMAFPLIIMALAVVATLGPGTENVIIAITIPFIPQCARVVRSSALALREIPYPYLIMLSAFVGQAILLEAVLSYLGMGVQDPTPAWGLMLKGGAEEYLESAPWMSIFPGLAISFAVFGFNLFGDGMRDVLDPKLRRE